MMIRHSSPTGSTSGTLLNTCSEFITCFPRHWRMIIFEQLHLHKRSKEEKAIKQVSVGLLDPIHWAKKVSVCFTLKLLWLFNIHLIEFETTSDPFFPVGRERKWLFLTTGLFFPNKGCVKVRFISITRTTLTNTSRFVYESAL